MDAINSIQTAPAETVVPTMEAVDSNKFDFVTEIENPQFGLTDDEDEPEMLDVGVNYSISGKYYPATFDSPAEYPDLDLLNVVILATGEDIVSKLTDSQTEQIDQECFADAERAADDAAYDRADRERNDPWL